MVVIVATMSVAVYLILDKYHYTVINELKVSCRKKQETVNKLSIELKALKAALEISKQRAKNRLSVARQDCVQQNLDKSIETIDKEFDHDNTEVNTTGKYIIHI